MTKDEQIKLLREAVEKCRFALEPFDDYKPRAWASDFHNLAKAHQITKQALAETDQPADDEGMTPSHIAASVKCACCQPSVKGAGTEYNTNNVYFWLGGEG